MVERCKDCCFWAQDDIAGYVSAYELDSCLGPDSNDWPTEAAHMDNCKDIASQRPWGTCKVHQRNMNSCFANDDRCCYYWPSSQRADEKQLPLLGAAPTSLTA